MGGNHFAPNWRDSAYSLVNNGVVQAEQVPIQPLETSSGNKSIKGHQELEHWQYPCISFSTMVDSKIFLLVCPFNFVEELDCFAENAAIPKVKPPQV